ncbi:MAG: hypothetical protein L6R36_000923 [Xanthoria steineri]|nr:MAG: hypothetical protein L6R36_000923 [Xanthoria steineri]
MNPHQKNKVDVNSMNEEEQKLFRLYGKLPNKKDLLQNKLKERKYFDSGDYALSKAGKASEGGVTSIGSQHPLPENIPHLTSPVPTNGHSNGSNGHSGSISHSGSMNSGSAIPGGQSGSPVKEASFLHRGMSVDEQAVESPKDEGGNKSPLGKESVPARWQG